MGICYENKNKNPQIIQINLNKKVIRKGDFIFPAGYIDIPIRMPNTRPIQHISQEELATALLIVLSHCIGTNRYNLIDETTRAYGFKRTGPKISNAMNAAVDWLIKHGKIEEVDGKLRIMS